MDAEDLTGFIDVPNLTRYLAERLPDVVAPLEIERHPAGFSNETFFITSGPRHWVLRRPPRGELLPTAHDVLREYRVLSGLTQATRLVPQPLLACEDASVIGVPFYVMERVEGEVIRDAVPPALDSPRERRRLGETLIDAIVELHGIDYEACGLGDLGRPQGFLERQLRRWKGQLEATLAKTRPLPDLEAVHDWLAAHLPESGPPTIVHGDFKLDNVIVASDPPARVVAVLDWELATLGDPLTDLGWLVAWWGLSGEPNDDLMGEDLLMARVPGFLTARELLARYEERSGRPVTNFLFYLCLGIWKKAIILEDLYRYYLEGIAKNPDAAQFEWLVPRLTERLRRLTAGR